jgi:hypothetical protein
MHAWILRIRSLHVLIQIALEKEVELNYVAYMTAAYGKADKLLPVEDSDTDIAMKEILCILPPGVQGSNAYFNDGRIIVVRDDYITKKKKKKNIYVSLIPLIVFGRLDTLSTPL